jgi:hypothetical protein
VIVTVCALSYHSGLWHGLAGGNAGNGIETGDELTGSGRLDGLLFDTDIDRPAALARTCLHSGFVILGGTAAAAKEPHAWGPLDVCDVLRDGTCGVALGTWHTA